MKLYYPKSHLDKSHRSLLFPLLKPFIKSDGPADARRLAFYNVSKEDFEFTELVEEADVVILTMAWNYYVNTKQVAVAVDFVNKCETLNKNVIAFNAGDFGVRIPYFKNLIVIRTSGYKSKFTNNEYSLPVFISDPLKKHFETDKLFENTYKSKAVVGFCGQANPSGLNAVKEKLKIALRNIKSYVGIDNNEPQRLLATSLLRASILEKMKDSEGVETNFILRKKYRAGVTSNKGVHKTTLEFYNNLKNSGYVVCVRGAGNFSIRLYETLAMGRIPIFINTDCALPLEEEINWKKHTVWVEYNERGQVVQKVNDFHNSLSEDDFIDLQHTNRNLWKEKLTMGGFFRIFLAKIANLD